MADKQLDPRNIDDAFTIVDTLTADVQMTRRNALAFQQALQTIYNAVPRPAPGEVQEKAPDHG